MNRLSKITFLLLVFATYLAPLFAPAEPNFRGRTAFEVLGVSKSSTNEEIEKVFKKLAMKFHPDRATAENAKDFENKFKIIKSCFEAIESLDEGLLQTHGLTLGLSDDEIRARKGSNYKTSAVSDEEWVDPFWFSESLNQGMASEQAKASKNGELMINDLMFKGTNVDGVFQNTDGVIIFTSKARFYWIPRGSRLIYPLLTTYEPNELGQYQGSLFDTRDPEGRVPYVMDLKRGVFKVRGLEFRNSQIVNKAQLNRDLALAGFELLGETLTPKSLNLWNYKIFFDGVTYTILAISHDPTQAVKNMHSYRLFVGNQKEMSELPVYYNKDRRRTEVPGRNVMFLEGRSHLQTPFFDEATGFHMGSIDLDPKKMDVFSLDTMRLVNSIPALPREEIYKLPLAGLLADHIELPKILRTPLDRYWISTLRPKSEGETLLLTSGNVSKTQAISAMVAGSDNGYSHERSLSRPRMDRWRVIREIKDSFPELGTYLEYPEGDSHRTVVEHLLLNPIQLEELRSYVQGNIRNDAARWVFHQFFMDMNTWELIDATLFIPEMIIRNYSNDPKEMVLATMFLARHAILNSPYPFPPKVQSLISSLRAIREPDTIQDYLDRYIRERIAQQPKLIGQNPVLKIENSECGLILSTNGPSNRPLLGH